MTDRKVVDRSTFRKLLSMARSRRKGRTGSRGTVLQLVYRLLRDDSLVIPVAGRMGLLSNRIGCESPAWTSVEDLVMLIAEEDRLPEALDLIGERCGN